MFKRLFLLFLLLSSFSTYASHLAGGEISYKCLGNGNYRFQVVIFRDCSGIHFNQASITLAGPVAVNCVLVGSYDITSNLGCGLVQCSPPNNFNAQKGGVSKFVYEGTANLNSLGVAPQAGYTWSTSGLPCCRNASTNSTCTGDMVLRVKMYSYSDASGTLLTPAQLCDNSPTFLEDPNLVVVVSPFDTAVFNGFGEDVNDGDVLRYSIDYPWTATNQNCNYSQGYTINSPMPGIIGSGIDSLTGVLRFNPTLSGAYNMVFRVGSYRRNQLVSEVFRDFQAMVISSPPSSPIPYNPAYTPGSVQYLQQQQSPKISGNITHPVNGLPERTIILYAGDTMRVDYTVKDSFPVSPTPNRVYSYVRSEVLGAFGTSQTTGCAEPPCAIIENLSSSSPVVQVNLRSRQQGYGLIADTAGWDVNGRLYWTPKEIHAQLGGAPAIRKYYFGVFAFDDVCPLAGSSAEFFEVNILPSTTYLRAPAAMCFEGLNSQSAQLRWPSLIDSVSLELGDSLVAGLTYAERLQRTINRRWASFVRSELYRVNLADSSFNLRATFSHPDSTSFVDSQIPADSLFAYTLRVISALDTQWLASSLPVVAITPQLVADRPSMTYQLSWPTPFTALGSPANFDGWYYLYSRNVSLQTPWVLVDSIRYLQQIVQPLQLGTDTLEFKIGWKSGSTCDLSYSFSKQVIFPLDMGVESQELFMQLYPNPVKNHLNIRLEGLNEPRSWKIYDMTGRLVKDGIWQKAPIDVSFLPAANYTLLLDFGDNRSNRAIFNKAD